ncbi:gibberellin 2-beta-dioxygenase 2-like [Phragmites australis]|uniref:gibberellin 2-beta-dioxygenase 2-like n=1 Tax=Phragmites australis TaxID=29695 RepID=UPI002D76A4EC|nr:gibberellin 2-beta-dioxygenase 2-like [Phragmites australis]
MCAIATPPFQHARTGSRHNASKLATQKLEHARAMVMPSAASWEMAPESLPLSIIPTVDMSAPSGSGELAHRLVRACAERGFFKAVNHGVPPRVAARLDAAASAFFARQAQEKQAAGPPDPLGYGSRNIGAHGDVGELEYLILHTDPAAVARKAEAIDTEDPSRFSQAVNEYVDAVRRLACQVLDLLGEGLGLRDPASLSRLISAVDSDSLLRINHYPPPSRATRDPPGDRSCTVDGPKSGNGGAAAARGIGFGEHTDPQILSVLRANDVDGLQVLLPDGRGGEDAWVQVPADPSAFFINAGDLLQALTNGRLVSIRHRVMASTSRPRLSTIYFAAPPLHARISALPETVIPGAPRRYRPFTWAEYKKAMYALRLSHNRLDLFHADGGVGGDGSEQ